jgi:hypothetical protein
MNVWVLLEDVLYEGSDILAIYATKEAAEEARKLINKSGWYSYFVEEHEVLS